MQAGRKTVDTYAIVILPPEDISKVIDSYRVKYARYTSYVIVPHITLVPPFFIEKESPIEIILSLEEGFKGLPPFKLILENVNFFEGKNNVAFVQPDVGSSDCIRNILRKTTSILGNRIRNAYNGYYFTPEKLVPHLTIAESIPESIFPEIKTEMGGLAFNYTFLVDSVFLFKQSEASNIWHPQAEIKFQAER
jgi:2'-5' RNA ligase